jgi:flagellar biosynthesis GTPase FlhF
MKTELDVSNIEGLDESLLDSYSNAIAIEKKEVDMGGLLRNESTKDLGDGFYLREGFRGGLYKKYIDGTIQRGFLIDGSGNVPLGETETVDLGNGKMMDRKKLIAYPKDKGFVKADGKGKFHYFEELSDLVKGEIARLNKLQSDAAAAAAALIDSQNKSAAEKEAARIAAEEANKKFQREKADAEEKARQAENKRLAEEKEKDRKFQLQKSETESKAKQAELKIAEQKRKQGETEAQTKIRLAEEESKTKLRVAETEAQSKEDESKAKTKKAMIIGGSVLALVAGFFIWKKFS